MKETRFIEQNKEKWAKFEQLRKDDASNPDELSDLFVEITEDLSYARTFYPRRSVRVYLNNLAQSVFNSLYKLKKDPFGNLWKFWKISLPLELYQARKSILAAFIVFGIAALIGIVSTVNDPEFASVVLGSDYVAMTDSFIESGDPMQVYKNESELPMFLYIFVNNIRVAFLTFALGIVVCVGAGFILMFNGIMVGTFQSYFHVKGVATGTNLLFTSFLTIWIHGTFEILSIVMSGAAGFVAGISILYPGSYTRSQSFQIGVKRGLKIMLGITPFIFIAAFFEGYVTRHTEMPVAMSLSIIFGSLAIFVGYFFIYPFIAYRKYATEHLLSPQPIYRPKRNVELFKLKQVNELVADSFLLFKQLIGKFSKPFWLIIFPLHAVLLYIMFSVEPKKFSYYGESPDQIARFITDGGGNPWWWYGPITLIFSITIFLALKHLSSYDEKIKMQSQNIRPVKYYAFFIIVPFVAFSGLLSSEQLDGRLQLLIFLLITPLIFYVMTSSVLYKKGFSLGFQYYFKNFGNTYGLYLLVSLVLIGMLILMVSLVYLFLTELIEWHGITTVSDFGWWSNYFQGIIWIIFYHYYNYFMIVSFGVLHFANDESEHSFSLFHRLKSFGTTSKTYESFKHNEE